MKMILRSIGPKAAVCLLAMLVSAAAQAEHYKVFLFGGQSNMDGRADPDDLPDSYKQPQNDVLYSHNRHFGALKPNPGFGPELSFGRTVADALTDENFAMIKYASGGSSLYEDWAPSKGNDYKRFTARIKSGCKALTDAGHTYEIVGMVWVQGESDAAEGRTTAQYQADLTGFIAKARSLYGKDLPFFFNRLGTNQTNLSGEPFTQISTAQENVAAEDSNAHLVHSDDLSMQDGVHFDVAGTLTLGQRLAKSYIATVHKAEQPRDAGEEKKR